MPNKRLSYRATRSALSQPLLGGQVSPEGVELEAQPGESMDKLSRSMLELRFDVSETSIATFTKALEQGLISKRITVDDLFVTNLPKKYR